MSNASSRDADVQSFRDFVTSTFRWRFAKTYVESFPHEYTLQQWTAAADFLRAIDCIEQWGVVDAFYSSRRKCLYVDERKHWHMGDPASARPEERPTLINRTWLDVSKYRQRGPGVGP